MYLYTAGQILFSVLAVFGAYALLRTASAVPNLPREAALLLRVPANTAPCDLPFLLERARENAFFAARMPIVALVERGADPVLTEALARADIAYYIVD